MRRMDPIAVAVVGLTLIVSTSGCAEHASGPATSWDVSGSGPTAPDTGGPDVESDTESGESDTRADRNRALVGFEAVAAGHSDACGIRRPYGHADCWAGPEPGTPALDYADIAVGEGFACGIDGTEELLCWGEGDAGQTEPPTEGEYVAVEAGYEYACAKRADGSLECWGASEFGQTEPPEGAFERFDTGYFHACGIRADGTLECWGLGTDPERDERESAGAPPSLAVDTDQAVAPDGRFRAVAAGGWHTCARTEDGAIECWGVDADGPHDELSFGQTEPPEEIGASLSAGLAHTCAGQHCFGLGSQPEVDELDGRDLPARFDALQDADQADSVERSDGYRTTVSGGDFSCGLDREYIVACWGDVELPAQGEPGGPGGPNGWDKEDTDESDGRF